MMKTKNDLVNLIKSLDPSKIVFWVGAGIDSNPPTSLPLASKLLEELIKQTCGKVYASKIKTQYELLYGENMIPRMETVISEIKLFESELADPSKNGTVVRGFSAFLDAPPNTCHQILTQYLKLGSNIVTLNYGNTFAKAFNLQYNASFPETPTFDSEMQLYLYSDGNLTPGKIYHPHGVANDLETIGISLGEVKKVLSPNFKRRIIDWITAGYCFIFLGYSCSDSLDINPFFESLNYLTNSNSRAILINYSSAESFDWGEQSKETEKLLTPFAQNNRIVFNTNTSKFLCAIKLHNIECKKTEVEVFNWTKLFRCRAVPYDKRLHKYMSLGIIKILGLDCRKILPDNWYKDCNYDLFRRHWYVDYYAFNCLTASKMFIEAKKFGKKLDKDNLTKSDIYSKLGFAKKAAQVTMPIEEIDKYLSTANSLNSVTIDWNISTALNRNAEWIILDILRHPLSFSRKIKQYSPKANIILRCNKKIIELGNDCVLEYFQYLTALRYYGVFLMIFENKYDDAINYLNQALSHYDATSVRDGSIRCKLFLSLVEMLNIKHCENSLKSAKSCLNDIKCCDIKSISPKDLYLYLLLKGYYYIQKKRKI